jgi:predicted lysophospholipase L1 biosynthesis ABC-type transport system permease subunit
MSGPERMDRRFEREFRPARRLVPVWCCYVLWAALSLLALGSVYLANSVPHEPAAALSEALSVP